MSSVTATRSRNHRVSCEGLFLGPDLWHTMRWIERDSVLLVLASDHYDESDYIRDYDTFVSRMQSFDGRRLQ